MTKTSLHCKVHTRHASNSLLFAEQQDWDMTQHKEQEQTVLNVHTSRKGSQYPSALLRMGVLGRASPFPHLISCLNDAKLQLPRLM